MPRASVTRWRLVPALPQSVGFEPVAAPLSSPARSRRRRSPGSPRSRPPRAGVRAAPDAGAATRRPPASRAAGASSSYRSRTSSRPSASPDGWIPSRSPPAVEARIGAKTSPDCPGPARVLPAATSAILVDPIEAVAPRRMGRAPSPLPPSPPPGQAWRRSSMVTPDVTLSCPIWSRWGPRLRRGCGTEGTQRLKGRGASSIVMTGFERQPGRPDHRQAPPPAGEVPSMDNRASGTPRRNARRETPPVESRRASGAQRDRRCVRTWGSDQPHRTTRQRGRSRRDLEASDASLSGSPRTRHMAGHDMGGPPSPGGHGPRRDAIFDDTGQWWHRGATAEARRRPIRPHPGRWSVSARSNAACRLVAAARRSDPGRRSPSEVVGRGDRRRAASRSPWATRPWSWPGVERLRAPCACAARGPPGRPPRRARRESDRRRSPGSRAQ